MNKLLIALMCCLVLTHTKRAFAEDGADAYDPFIDYNEFEIEDEEEADINFFRNGRFVTAGGLIGTRMFTEGMANIYKNDIAYGLYLSYFFDLRLALQFSYATSSHRFKVASAATLATGTVKLSGLSFDFKYYVNTQNITKGLATLNPYFIGGFTSYSRESTVDGQPEFGKDSALAFDAGLGVEIPMMRSRMYLGAQAVYHLVSFPDENKEVQLNTPPEATGKYLNGDIIELMGIIGFNF